MPNNSDSPSLKPLLYSLAVISIYWSRDWHLTAMAYFVMWTTWVIMGVVATLWPGTVNSFAIEGKSAAWLCQTVWTSVKWILRDAAEDVESLLPKSTTIDTTSKSLLYINKCFSSQYHYCYDEASLTDANVLVGQANESCVEVCESVDMKCSETMLKQLNACNRLYPYAQCSECTQQSQSFAPAIAPNGACVVANMPMLLNCNNRGET